MGSVNYVVSLSGGKDSTALLLLMLEKNISVHSVVFFDTGWEFPQMHAHLDQLEKYTGVKIVRLAPKRSFTYWMFERPVKSKETRIIKTGILPPPKEEDFDDDDDFRFEFECWELDPFEYKRIEKGEVHRIGNGWPSPSRRWCTRQKVSAIDAHSAQIENPIQCIGYAADESHRAKGKTLNSKKRFEYRFPLIEWGIDERTALAICKSHGFDWGGLYDHFSRVSCFCCPLTRLNDLRILRNEFPELWGQMLEWDSKIPGKNRGFKGYATVHDLDHRFEYEESLLALLKSA